MQGRDSAKKKASEERKGRVQAEELARIEEERRVKQEADVRAKDEIEREYAEAERAKREAGIEVC